MDLHQAGKIFITAKQAENISNRTIYQYNVVLKKFFEYLIEQNIFDVEEIKPDTVRGFIVEVSKKKVDSTTLHRHFRTIKTLSLFLFREDYTRENFIRGVKPPKLATKIMRTFTPQEISKLLNSFDKNTFFGLRNYTIMAMFFSTGIRKMELSSILLNDVNITNDLIRINGKGNKERFVPIGRTLRRSLIQYMKMRLEYLDGESCSYLFVTPRANRVMTPSCLGVLFQKLKKTLKLQGNRISSHTWRHTFAKNYLLNGGDIFSLQKILGHADIETTRIYLNLNENEIKAQHARFNPLDNRNWLT